MRTLYHITGEKLTLKFSPEGALSSARLEGRDVTHELVYVKEDNFLPSLSLFGFATELESHILERFHHINQICENVCMSVLKAEKTNQDVWEVYMCSSRDPSFVNRVAIMSLHYSFGNNKFVEVVRTY